MRDKRFSRAKGSILVVLLLLGCLLVSESYGWGFFAHKWIGRTAVDAVPAQARPFFQQHREYLSEHAIDPDLWRKHDPDEGVRHYIDIDLYGPYPFDALPRDLAKARQKFGADTVNERGIGPWWVVKTYNDLVRLMRKRDVDSTLVKAAALCHYVSDLCVPLHTTENYDGQLTGNKGIHRRFEATMIEMYADSLKLTVRPAQRIKDPLAFIFDLVLRSYSLHQK
ncbi:MAG: S1/P1 Nuclease, partial [Calditrichaeota bacterium]